MEVVTKGTVITNKYNDPWWNKYELTFISGAGNKYSIHSSDDTKCVGADQYLQKS